VTPAVLVLAGLDPSGGAGLLADAEAIRAAGARPLCVATALTVQTSRRALRFQPVDAALIEEQCSALIAEEPIASVKLGMLGGAEAAAAASRAAARVSMPLVIDPVLRASSGAGLFVGDARAAYAELLRLGPVVTPNLAEARDLLALPAEPRDSDEMAQAGRALVLLGAKAALVKGGHLAGDAVDVLVTATARADLRGSRLAGSKRGTGCRLASTLAARLALGDDLETAARWAKQAVAAYLAG
jgi:hydroxymethylpyrimidine/phosphomethylpyrimidine kinase